MDSLTEKAIRQFAVVFRRLGKVQPHIESAEGPGWFRAVTRTPHPLGNYSILDPYATGEIARESSAVLSRLDLPTSVFLSDASPSESAAKELSDLGYEHVGAIPVMTVRNVELSPTQLPEGVEFRPVYPESFDPWIDALELGYGLPRALCEMCALLDRGEAELRAYGAYRDGRVLSTSLLFLHDGLAGIYCVATLPEERGKGIASHMTAEPLRLAAKEGYEYGTLQASTAGYPIYRKLGFEDCSSIPMYVKDATAG